MKRIIAFLLVLSMVLSLAACGAPAQDQEKPGDAALQLGNTDEMDRQDKELIAELIGGQDGSAMTDQELDDLIDQLIGETEKEAGVVNLGNQKEEPKVEFIRDEDAYDEEGGMTKPFDQVYPELIEKEQVAFSGESILIKLKNDQLTDGLKAAGIGALHEIVSLEKAAWYEAKLTEGTDPKEAIAAVRQLKEVLLAEYNYEVQTAALDDYKHFDKDKDEDFKKNGHNKDQWHFHYVGIPDGYEEMETEGGDPSVIVAVIDSGVDYTHEDLKDNMWVNKREIPDNGIDDDKNGYIDDYYGIDIVAGKGNGDDTNGHGTHVAGIIAARNNNVGTLGVAYNVKIMSVKAAAHNGTLNQADIAEAVQYAYKNGAEVINMSFGGTACSIAVQDALATAYTRCVLVASAGNSGRPNEDTDFYKALPNYPAALTYVLGVMSVDENGVESSFTNWDTVAYNGVEYEVYAPGENIMSTLPGNQYGYLSGTSMAAPIVSSFAAILRSEFSDRDKYPTKFIYGQLASTSEYYADCINPQMHGAHNLPQIVNLEAALTKLPKPEVGVQDYALFDDPKYSSKNNGDGVIDAGETIALGLTLRNRWGMSENTLVTIDTKFAAGLDDPYITIQNPTVNYGSVGTYSTQDCGKVWTDELHTGWEDPFLITISQDCPNDYRFTLNITITCENALDEEDTTVYGSRGSVMEAVRSGYILPSIIEEDMVLSKDNLYIIPNSTVIQEGVTVRVEPGTHIQFWSDDPSDPYADDYVACLLVKGSFLVAGTKEEPVYIYPSELMGNYNVELGASSKGYIALRYADVTNLSYCNTVTTGYKGNGMTGTSNWITNADHCTFRRNYTYLSHRYVSSGKVYTSSTGAIGNISAQNCVFLQLQGKMLGQKTNCVFVECGINADSFGFNDCVFLNCTQNMAFSSFVSMSVPTSGSVYYRKETGTTYISTSAFKSDVVGAHPARIETEDELNWLNTKLQASYSYNLGIKYDLQADAFVWANGEAIADFVDPNGHTTKGNRAASLFLKGGEIVSDTYASNYLYEIPGEILPLEITFQEYEVTLDLLKSYQITPINTPAQLPADMFLYESRDESVVTVDQGGFVTPVGLGTADVYVYSRDRAVFNYITFHVKEYVPLEAIELAQSVMMIPLGQTATVDYTCKPYNTTRNQVKITSGNESVIQVTQAGELVAVGLGTAEITLTCEGISAKMTAQVYNQATELSISMPAMVVHLEDAMLELPDVQISENAVYKLVWNSSDTEVAEIIDGKLVLKKTGMTAVAVTDKLSGLSDEMWLYVIENAFETITKIQLQKNAYSYALTSDGSLWAWAGSNIDNGYTNFNSAICEDVVDFDCDGLRLIVARADGSVAVLAGDGMNEVEFYDSNYFAEYFGHTSKIIDVEICKNNKYALREDGAIFVWGNNENGELGLGYTGYIDRPTQSGVAYVPFNKIVAGENFALAFVNYDSVGYVYHTWFSDSNYDGGWSIFTEANALADDDTIFIRDGYANYCTYTIGNSWVDYYQCNVDLSGYECMSFQDGVPMMGVKDNSIYCYNGQEMELKFQNIGTVTAIDAVADDEDPTFIFATSDGLMMGYGSNGNNNLSDDYNKSYYDELTLTQLYPKMDNDRQRIIETNLADSALTEDSLVVTFSKPMNYCEAYVYYYVNGEFQSSSSQRATGNTIKGKVINGFQKGVNYTARVYIYDVNYQCVETVELTFTYDPPSVVEKVIHQSQTDTSIDRHYITFTSMKNALTEYRDKQKINTNFYGNAILNPISTSTDVSTWFRVLAPTATGSSYATAPLGGNWWGSTNETAIGLQLIDYADFPTSYARLMYAPYLTEAPENTFPFVTTVKLFNKKGEEVKTVGNEQVTFQVKFNRDMDTSIPLQVRFGSAYPYGDYEIAGKYVDARTWEGVYTLNTVIENGNQFFTISNGCSATEDLMLQTDRHRFGFVIDTTAAQALIMQGTATDTGVELRWTQDDFDTLLGYNVYRSTKEDGQYTRLNKTAIPANTMSFFDDTVEPGKVYYYNFTVVKTDLTESEPSGKIVIMSKDTMAPNIYHSPVSHAFAGENQVIEATITDNLNIAYANLYYRVAGTEEWGIVRMNKLNDQYSAIIPAAYVTVDGIEYYIEAFDGVSFTYKGSAEAPYTMAVQEAVDANALGDVDGDGAITNLDALKLLYAINDKYNMTAEEFARADLNGDGELWAAEALRILQYVSGEVGSVKM